jgi:hypothetical protein
MGFNYSKRYTGAPTVGAWNPGDEVLDSSGRLWRCITAGTPGIWTLVNKRVITYSVSGAVAAAAGAHRFTNDTGNTLTIMAVRATVGTGPTGASLIVDVNKNGATIFTTQGNRPTIGVSTNSSGKVTNMNVTTLEDGAYLTVDVDQVGSTVAGSDLVVTIEVAG